MLSSNNCMLSSTQPNSSSKFGGSTFSITRHKKVDLSALEEAHAEIISDGRDANISPVADDRRTSTLSEVASVRYESSSTNQPEETLQLRTKPI